MKFVILAAGIGSRLGKGVPKCLNELPSGESIIERQKRIFQKYSKEIYAVVGFKKEYIMELNTDLLYVYNHLFNQTILLKVFYML